MNVIDWLLDSDPSIRWQVLRDLTDATAAEVAAARARVATEGWGAHLLSLQGADGGWPRADTDPEWSCLLHLLLLLDLGLDPTSEEARRAVGLVRDNATWHWWGDKPFFEGEVEPCINGRVVTIGSYFGQDVDGLVDRLLGEQMEDGGWNCEAENGSTRGSFHTTICVLEGLLEHDRATGGRPEVRAALTRGQDYLLARPVRLPDLLPLRRPARARPSAANRCRSGRADGRRDRAGGVEARRRRPLATRARA